MTTPWISIVYFVIAALVGALEQYLYKSGADQAGDTFLSYLNFRILTGVVCYIAVMLLFIAAFKKGGAMSVLYPIYASTFIWGAFIAMLAFHEPIRPVNIAGMLVLIAGMWLMGLGK